MKPKILIVQPEIYMWGGAERQIAQLANHLTDNNYPVTILTMRTIPAFREALKEARIIEVGMDMNKLATTVQNIAHKFDIINPHNHPCELMLYPKKMPAVWQLNEPPIEVLKGEPLPEIYKQIARDNMDRIFVITDYEQGRSSKLYDRKDIIVNYPGVRYEYFSEKVEPKDKYNLKDKFVILEAGYITFTKNQVAAVEILAEVKKSIPNAVLVLAGYDQDQYKLQVQSKALELKVDKDVIFTGYIADDSDVRDLYNIADVYIAPFLDQGGWATTFEACCAGCPIIVSPKFVAENLVREHNLGVVTEVENFAKKIIEMKDTPQSDYSDWIGKNLTWKAFGERYEKVFEEIWHENEYSYNDN